MPSPGQKIMSVVIDTYMPYLRVIAGHQHRFTCLVWGWRGLEVNPPRYAAAMATPFNLLTSGKQDFVPFLFRATGQEPPYKVTHVALCGRVYHREQIERDQFLSKRLYRIRVEHEGLMDEDGGKQEHRHWYRLNHAEANTCASFYVVIGGEKLVAPGGESAPIPYDRLTLATGRRKSEPLSTHKGRGYSLVWLPETLTEWYSHASEIWRYHAAAAPPPPTSPSLRPPLPRSLLEPLVHARDHALHQVARSGFAPRRGRKG